MSDQIKIYQTKDNQTTVEVKFGNDTVWLGQKQIAFLFNQTKQNISLHINNCFKEGELDKKPTDKEYLIVQKEGNRSVKRNVIFYNLDVIISVGYRVKFKQGTQFGQWATQRLKEHLIGGYSINHKRLEQKNQEVIHLKTGIKILSRVIEEKAISSESNWLSNYAIGLKLFDDYDHEKLDIKGRIATKTNFPSLAEYQQIIVEMKP